MKLSMTADFAIANAIRNSVALVCFLAANTACAQFRLDIERVAEEAFRGSSDSSNETGDMVLQEDNQVVLRAGNARGVVQMGALRVKQAPIVVVGPDMERFIFQVHRSEDATRANLEQKLSAAIRSIELEKSLTEAQKKKLHLAGQGDIALLMAEANQFRTVFEGAAVQGRDELLKLINRIQPLQRKLKSNRFGDGSIFSRVLAGIHEAEDHRRFESARLEIHQVVYRGAVGRAVGRLHQRHSISPKQRQQIMELMQTETNLPKADFSSPQAAKHMVQYALFQLAKQPNELSTILDEQQRHAIEPMLKQAIAMEDTLRQAGYIR